MKIAFELADPEKGSIIYGVILYVCYIVTEKLVYIQQIGALNERRI